MVVLLFRNLNTESSFSIFILINESNQLFCIYKINVDNDPYIADAFNIQAIPTLLFIPMEGRYKVQTGGVSKEELVNMIKENCFK